MKELDGGERLLVARAQRGSVDAFEELYRQHERRIYGICRRLLDHDDDAEEMTQKVFVQAWRKLGGFRGASQLGTWLHRIAINLVTDEWRRAWRREIKNSVPIDELDGRDARTVTDGRAEPGVAIDLERAVSELPAGSRRVLILHDIEGLTHREIASRLGVSVGTSKTQLFRARRALKERIG